jgi:hypothetical protein
MARACALSGEDARGACSHRCSLAAPGPCDGLLRVEGEVGQAEEGGVPDDTHTASLDASDDSGSIGLVVCACEGAGGVTLLVLKCRVDFARGFVSAPLTMKNFTNS